MAIPEDLAGLDIAAALGRVGGDEELLSEIAEIFLEQCPEALSEVKNAVEARDSEALQHAAHAIKGSVSNFGAKDAFDAALKLEMMGRHRNLSGSGEALLDLERSLAALCPKLEQLTAH